MDRAAAEAIVTSYEALVSKAVAICNAPGPPWVFLREEKFVRLTFEGETAVITGLRADTFRAEMPVALLFMSDEELAAWRVNAKIEREAEQARRRAEEISAKEAEERATLEMLKRKYEN